MTPSLTLCAAHIVSWKAQEADSAGICIFVTEMRVSPPVTLSRQGGEKSEVRFLVL